MKTIPPKKKETLGNRKVKRIYIKSKRERKRGSLITKRKTNLSRRLCSDARTV